MNTDELIRVLATGSARVRPHAVERRYALAVSCGTAGALALMLSILPVRADLFEAALLPLFWLKLGFVASVTLASLFAVLRLSRPGSRLDRVPGVIAAPLVLMWAFAIHALLDADPERRLGLFLGATWRSCPLLIALISVPMFAAVIWVMKGLAPTRLRLAGFAAGLLSGAMAALVYCLHCPEIEAPFVGFWYVLGMMIPAGLGAWLGETLLRW